MELRTVTVLFYFLGLSCWRVSAMPPEAAAIFEKAGVRLADADLFRVAEVYNYWGQKGESIWPGVDVATVPVQFVFPEKMDILIGHPDPPADCVRENIVLPGLNKTFCHAPGRTFLHGAATGPLNKVPTLSANTMGEFDDYANDYYRKNGLDRKYQKLYLQYLGELAHEMFHGYQDNESRYLPEKEKLHRPLKVMKVDYPYQDEEAALLLALEGRVLAALLDEKDPEKVRELWRDFSAAREERHKRLAPDMVRLERYMELKEGTAQYVGWSVQYGGAGDVKPLPETAADPRFSGYPSSDTLKDVIKQSLAQLDSPLAGRWMLYVYYTGAALSYNMDKAAPGWKKEAFRRMSGLYGGLDTIVTAGVPLKGGSAERLKGLYERYKAEELRAGIRKVLGKDLAENKAKLDKFLLVPGKRYSLVFRGVKPEDLQISATVLLTEYLEKRIFEAGISGITADGKGTVEFSKALPVLFDKKTGRFDFTVPEKDAAAPEIKAKKTAIKNGYTRYSGVVEFKSGFFSWKGERLEVAEKDGLTTLTF
jgi:hypothetical protein